MVVKVVNYNVGLAAELGRLYPGAVFVGLIRDAVGVCEGRTARGGDLEAATAVYNYVGGQLIGARGRGCADPHVPLRGRHRKHRSGRARGVRVVRPRPGGTLGLRLQNKERVYDASGTVVGARVTDACYPFEDVGRHMRHDPNAGAASRLSEQSHGAGFASVACRS